MPIQVLPNFNWHHVTVLIELIRIMSPYLDISLLSTPERYRYKSTFIKLLTSSTKLHT
jgi:hypothetical protein